MTKLSCSIFGKAASTLVGLAMCVGLWSVDANAQQPAPSVEQDVAPKPALWRFSDEDSTLWIFGSVHLLDPDLKWRRPELEKALAEVEYVYFEAPLDYFSQAKAQMIVLDVGMNPPGVKLSESLSPEMVQKLDEVAQTLGVSGAALEPMKPWLAVATLSALMAKQTGAETTAGVDVILAADALKAGKELRHFETLEQQIRFFSDMPHDVQVELLISTIVEYEAAPDMLDGIVSAWVSGDLQTMETTILAGVDTAPPMFYDVFFVQRNTAWAEELDAFLAGSGDALVVVGAGHMVGPDSLIELLTARGHTVERF